MEENKQNRTGNRQKERTAPIEERFSIKASADPPTEEKTNIPKKEKNDGGKSNS